MTLLGKLFRPWNDSSSNEDHIISCEETTRNKKNTLDLNIAKCSRGGNRDEACRKNVEKSCVSRSSQKRKEVSTETVKVHQRSLSKGAHVNKPSASKGLVKREISLSNGNEGGNKSEQSRHSALNETCSGIPSCCEPPSPAEFDLYCNGSAFLYPNANTLNELARLSRHDLTAMGLLPPEPISSLKVRRQRPKRFQCPHCQVAFSNNGQLRGHIRIHTGERPFVCEEEGCGKSFTRNEELTRHRRIHSGLRPFPCSYCGKKFGRKDHLKKHTRTHQRGVYNSKSAFVIGYGNPFMEQQYQPFHQNLLSSTPFVTPNSLITLQSQYSSFSQQTQPVSLSLTATPSSSSSSSVPTAIATASASASASSNTNNAIINSGGPLLPITTTSSPTFAYPHPNSHHHNPFSYHNNNYAMNLL